MNDTEVNRRIKSDTKATHEAILEAMVAAGLKATWGGGKHDVLFLRPNSDTRGLASPTEIGNVRLVDYSSPWQYRDRPFIYRFHVNHFMSDVPARALFELTGRKTASRPCFCPPGDRMELSCTPEELSALAAWLPSWLIDPSSEPPVPVDRRSGSASGRRQNLHTRCFVGWFPNRSCSCPRRS